MHQAFPHSATTNATAATKARVWEVLINPINETGLRRPKRCSVDGWMNALSDLASKVAYLQGEELAMLRDGVLEGPDGPGRDTWPSTARIISQAHAIRRPPPSYSQKVTSYMKSAAGKAALSEGWAGNLLVWLRDNRGCPGEAQIDFIKRAAAEDARRREKIAARRKEKRSISDDDKEWLEWATTRDDAAKALVEGAKETVVAQ